MVFFNYALRKLNAKIVYYGPGLCGKTTNLVWIHDHFEGGERGKMISLATEGDRTIFFDLLPIEIGSIRGMDVTLQLYTVPGQVHYNSTRQLVLRGADGVVFVADSQRAMQSSNIDSFKNLQENLLLQGIALDGFPLVLQFNKRDLRDTVSVEELNDDLNTFSVPIFEAVATSGVGVQETLEGIVKLVMRNLRERYEGAAAGARTPGFEGPTPAKPSLRMPMPGGVRPPQQPAAPPSGSQAPGTPSLPPAPPLEEQAKMTPPPPPTVRVYTQDEGATTVDFSKTQGPGFIEGFGVEGVDEEAPTSVYQIGDELGVDAPEAPAQEEQPASAPPVADEFDPHATEVLDVGRETFTDMHTGHDLQAPETREAEPVEPQAVDTSEADVFQPAEDSTPEFELDDGQPEGVLEPAPEPALEALSEPAPEPEPEPLVESLPEPEPEPVLEAEPELVSEPFAEPFPEPEFEPPVEPVPEPELASETLPDISPELEPEQLVEPVSEPDFKYVAEQLTETVSEPEPEQLVELISEPELAAEPPQEAVSEPEPEPLVEPVSEPEFEYVAEQLTEPVSGPEPEPVLEPASEPEVEFTAEQLGEPVSEPEPEPLVEPASEPEPEPEFAAEPLAEPFPEAESLIGPEVEFSAEQPTEPVTGPEPEPFPEVSSSVFDRPTDEQILETATTTVEADSERAAESFADIDTGALEADFTTAHDEGAAPPVEAAGPASEDRYEDWISAPSPFAPKPLEASRLREVAESAARFADLGEPATGEALPGPVEPPEPPEPAPAQLETVAFETLSPESAEPVEIPEAVPEEPAMWEETSAEEILAEESARQEALDDGDFSAQPVSVDEIEPPEKYRVETAMADLEALQEVPAEPPATEEAELPEEIPSEPLAVEEPELLEEIPDQPPPMEEPEQLEEISEEASPIWEPEQLEEFAAQASVMDEAQFAEETLAEAEEVGEDVSSAAFEAMEVEEPAAIEPAERRDVSVTAGDNALQLRLHGTGAIVESGQVRELDIEVPVPGAWVGNRRVTLQLRLTLTPDTEDENGGPGSPS
jgi:signal recognition particle receptor subunit beta